MNWKIIIVGSSFLGVFLADLIKLKCSTLTLNCSNCCLELDGTVNRKGNWPFT